MAAVLGLLGGLAAASAPAPETDPDADGVLVAFHRQAPPAARLSLVQRLGLEAAADRALPFFARLRLGPKARQQGLRLGAAIAQLRRDPSVRLAEPDFRIRASLTPNDPSYPQLWGLNNTGQSGGSAGADIDAPEAWEKTTGSSSVVVAVVDSGVDTTHPDLTDNILRDGQGKVVGYDFVSNDANPQDDYGHGTHVAGTIGATGNNGKGVTGVCWQVRIMPVKFLDSSGSGSTSDAIAAIDWATQHGARIINASWGGAGYSQLLGEAIGRARAAGVLFVAAAGNESHNNDGLPTYPANYNQTLDNVLSVAATDDHDVVASFSNYGRSTVDIAAPGDNVLSTYKGGAYQLMSGTSMATPHVAGAAALVLSRFPGSTYQQLKARLLNTVDTPFGVVSRVATGRLNVNRALVDDSVAPGSPSGLQAVQRSSDGLLLTWTASGDDGAAGAATAYELRYSGSPITDANFALAALAPSLPVPGVSGTPQSYLLGGLSSSAQYYVALRATDKVGNASPLVTFGPVGTLSAASPVASVTDNVEGPPLFVGQGAWAVTTEAFSSASHSYTDSPGAPYQPKTDASLTLGSSVSLAGLSPRLQFKVKTDLEDGYDFLMVEVSGDEGQTWTRLPLALTGTSDWTAQDLSLARFYGQSILVRFRILTDSIVQAGGAWLDDIVIGGVPLQNISGPQVPLAPSNFHAQATSQTSVHLSWQDNSADETSFRVERRVGASGSGWTVIANPDPDQTQVDDPSVAAGTTYTYRIFAVNGVGDSPAAAALVTTPPFPPGTPTGLSCTSGPSSLSLAWTAAPGASTYTVRRSTTQGGPYSVLQTGVANPAYVDPAVTFGTTYYYTVSAVNGGGESAASGEVSGSPTAVPPPAPTRVRATRPGLRQSVITWKQSTGKGITKNRIYRASDPAGPWALVAEVPKRVRYVDRGLDPTVAYSYTVTALNSQGVESPRSVTVSVRKKR